MTNSTKISGLCLLLLAGCASADDMQRAGPIAAAPPPVVVDSAGSNAVPSSGVIAKLRLRDVDLVITRADTGPRFAVVSRGGLPLAKDLEEADLREHHPELYSVYRFGIAHGPFLDARLDLPRERPGSPDGF